jgi:hypothetical protein
VCNQIFSLAAATDDAENAIAGLYRADDVGSQGVDFTGVFETRNFRGRAGRSRIDPLALQQVSPIQSAGPHTNADLVASRLGRWQLADFKDLRAAVTGDDDCFQFGFPFGSSDCSRQSAGGYNSRGTDDLSRGFMCNRILVTSTTK